MTYWINIEICYDLEWPDDIKTLWSRWMKMANRQSKMENNNNNKRKPHSTKDDIVDIDDNNISFNISYYIFSNFIAWNNSFFRSVKNEWWKTCLKDIFFYQNKFTKYIFVRLYIWKFREPSSLASENITLCNSRWLLGNGKPSSQKL